MLILDEATSSVDSETDRVMQRVIKEVFEGYTIISVAHRVSFLENEVRSWLIENSLIRLWIRIRLQ